MSSDAVDSIIFHFIISTDTDSVLTYTCQQIVSWSGFRVKNLYVGRTGVSCQTVHSNCRNIKAEGVFRWLPKDTDSLYSQYKSFW